jgi:hypothetical protein
MPRLTRITYSGTRRDSEWPSGRLVRLSVSKLAVSVAEKGHHAARFIETPVCHCNIEVTSPPKSAPAKVRRVDAQLRSPRPTKGSITVA